MSTDTNVAILKEAYTQYDKTRGGNLAQIFAFMDDNISFGSLLRGAAPVEFASQYDNKQELHRYFEGLLGSWSMQHYTINEYVAQGDVVFARGSCAWTNKQTGKSVETPKVDYWRFKDGKAVEFFEYFDTAEVIKAAT
jgi:ketosteroid isomerase-like protein